MGQERRVYRREETFDEASLGGEGGDESIAMEGERGNLERSGGVDEFATGSIA